jgi:yeast amino acid transporter
MVGFHRKKDSQPEVVEKTNYDTYQQPASPQIPDDQEIHGIEYKDGTRLHRGLKARHITMIAIGGAIGTGLIIGTGSALARAGPGSIFISYSITGFIVYLVMCALGEMAAWLPLSSGFTGYATRFCDPALGFALGWT